MSIIKSFLILVSVFIQQVILFEQHEYKIIHERVVIDDYNPEHIENPVVTLFQYNETSVAFNSSGFLKTDLNNDLWAHMKIFTATDGGKYRQYPGKYIINLCEAQKEDVFGTRDIFDHSNLTDCPIAKGYYYISNYRPDESKFPAWVPYGKLFVDIMTYHGDVYLTRSLWYGRVEPL